MSFANSSSTQPSLCHRGLADECLDCNEHGWIVGEDLALRRCSACDRFRTDLEAALAFFGSMESVLFSLDQIVLRRVL